MILALPLAINSRTTTKPTSGNQTVAHRTIANRITANQDNDLLAQLPTGTIINATIAFVLQKNCHTDSLTEQLR